ncbi:MAG TPA: hypothetical protein VF784_00240 [Anaerolineales bacterium]
MSNQSGQFGQDRPRTKIITRPGASEAVYGLGLIGALVYYIQHAATLGMGLLGVLKAIVWPAMLIYQALAALKM